MDGQSSLIKRNDLKKESLLSARDAMNEAFPDANITSYESLIPALFLPDEKDRHILAAAIKGKADAIVTFNTKDFPIDAVMNFDVEILHPDHFVNDLISLDGPKARDAFTSQVKKLRNPPKTAQEVLLILSKSGLVKTALKLTELLGEEK